MSNHYFMCFFKQKTAYGMRIGYWSSDLCSSDLPRIMGQCRRHTCPYRADNVAETKRGDDDSDKARNVEARVRGESENSSHLRSHPLRRPCSPRKADWSDQNVSRCQRICTGDSALLQSYSRQFSWGPSGRDEGIIGCRRMEPCRSHAG